MGGRFKVGRGASLERVRRRGKHAAAIVSTNGYERQPRNLYELIHDSPMLGADLDLERAQDLWDGQGQE